MTAPSGGTTTDAAALLAAIERGEVHADDGDVLWWGDRPLTTREVLWLCEHNDYATPVANQVVRLSPSACAFLAEARRDLP